MKFKHPGHFLLAAAALMFVLPAQASTLDDVRKHGSLRCGVNGALAGMSSQDKEGKWSGMDADICRAVAAATLGDADKVEFIALNNEERLTALAQGRIDLLARNTTWNMRRDTEQGIGFVAVSYYDGQSLMLPKSSGLRSTLQTDGLSVCVQARTTSSYNLKRYFTVNKMKVTIVPVASLDEQRSTYLDGKCDAISTDRSQLYALRAGLDKPDDHRILPEVISKEPLSPATRKGDAQWQDIVRWSLFSLINAEELGISSHNVDRVREQARTPAVQYILGGVGNAGAAMGLSADWAYNIIKQVGNYGEVFERNLAPLGIKRGLNALWHDGGLLYAPPIN